MATCPFKSGTTVSDRVCDISCAVKIGNKCALVVIAEKLSEKKSENTTQK